MDNNHSRRLKVRTATAADIPEIVRIVNLAYVVEQPLISGNRTETAEIEERLQKGGFLVIDAEWAGHLCGAVYFSLSKGRGYLGMLAVDPKFQRRGLSKLLVAAVEDECRRAGGNFLDITVLSLRKELFPFYTKLGFFPSSILPYPRPQLLLKELHLVQMTKPLRPAEEL